MKEPRNKTKKRCAHKAGVVILVLVAFGAGFMLRGSKESTRVAHDHETAPIAEKKAETWTCSMHPQIKLPKLGQCPICGMDLIPLIADDDDEGGLREVSVSENAAKLMNIETVPVERRFVTANVRMVGKIDYDETRVSYITAWVPGRLDRLFVDYTGVPVKKGDHMVDLYSPELLSAQEELLQAINATQKLEQSDSSTVRDSALATVTAVREKLRLWGLMPEQIEAIEQRGKPDDHMTIYAPSGGIVIHKNAQEGMYVNVGTRIYTIADLSRVWVNLDAYESDLAWLRYGQQVQFTTESDPGEIFTGTISFIQPVLDEATRTVKVRVNVPNADGRLKPGMFVRAVAAAEVATHGRIMDAALAGKWICPMHPEIVKDGPETCDVCGMPLATAESLGYVGRELTDEDRPLVIPATAALLTGKRAVVYVKLPDKDKPTFEGREIVLGRRAGDYYLVQDGLAEGERVVTRGNFKLDAELQIQAKPSMMTPEGGGDMTGMDHGDHQMAKSERDHEDHAVLPALITDPAFRKQLADVIDRYMDIQAALSEDDEETTAKAIGKATAALSSVDMSLIDSQAHTAWMKFHSELKPLLSSMAEAKDIQSIREQFYPLSETVAALTTRFHPFDETIYQLRCPMAFDDRGATWLQKDEAVRNPYFGAAMYKCGGVIKEIESGEK